MKRLLFILALVCAPTYAQTNTARMLSGTNVVTLCPYTVQATDQTKLLILNSTSACAVNLPSATTLNFGPGAIFAVKNQGAGTVTITPAMGTISGSPSLSLTTGQGADIYSDGVNYQVQQGAGTGGGGGGSPAGSNFQAQVFNSGSLGFTPCVNVSVPSSLSATANIDCDAHNAGPNPWVDVTRYGVRSCTLSTTPCIAGIIATTHSGNPVVNLSSASTFQNGDGVTVKAVGSPQSMSTPGAPTVTPSIANVLTGTRMVSNGPTGSTSYSYEIFAEDKNGGLTAVSSAGTTTTGAASLGSQSVSITSCARSNATVTCLTSSPHGYAVGTSPQIAYIQSTSDTTLNGWFTITNVPDTTHFIFLTSVDTRNSGPAASVGGTVTWWNCNHITWTRVTGAYRYWIAGRSGGSLTTIGYSWPENSLSTGISGFPMTEGVNSWDDFGATMMGNLVMPFWIPTTPPASATNDNLTTTILSGGGTTALTLAVAPSVTSSGGTFIVLDAVPGILAAQTAATGPSSTGLPIYFPSTSNPLTIGYPVNSYLDLTSANTSLLVNGTLWLNNTLALNRYSKITGYQAVDTTTSFSFDSLPLISVGTAYPGIHIFNGVAVHVEGVSIQGNASANNNLLVVQDFGGANPGSFYKRVEFSTGGGNDIMGIGLLARGVPGQLSAQMTLEEVLTIPGPGTTQGVTATPSILCADCASLIIKSIQASHRGIYHGMDSGGGGFRSDSLYFQGSLTPAITMASADGNSFTPVTSQSVFNGQATMDSTGNPLVWFGPGSTSTQLFMEHEGVTGLGTNNITGYSPAFAWGRSPVNPNQALGSNTNALGPVNACTDDGIFVTPVNACQFMTTFYAATPLAVAPSYSIFVDQTGIASPTAAVVSGGSLALGSHSYQIAPVWLNGGLGNSSHHSNSVTTTSGNQTVTVTWTPVGGGCLGYALIRDNGLVSVPGSYISGCATSSFSDTGYSGGGTLPGIPGGSSTMLMPGTQGIESGGPVNAPSIALYNGTTNFTGSLVTAGVTANRTYTFPDASGTVCLIGASCNAAVLNLTAQTASIAATTLYATGTGGAGMYAVYADIITTTAGTGGTVTVTVAWNNGTTTPNLFSTPFALNALGEQPALLGTFYCAASQNITYSTTVVGASGSPQYALRIRLVYLG